MFALGSNNYIIRDQQTSRRGFYKGNHKNEYCVWFKAIAIVPRLLVYGMQDHCINKVMIGTVVGDFEKISIYLVFLQVVIPYSPVISRPYNERGTV